MNAEVLAAVFSASIYAFQHEMNEAHFAYENANDKEHAAKVLQERVDNCKKVCAQKLGEAICEIEGAVAKASVSDPTLEQLCLLYVMNCQGPLDTRTLDAAIHKLASSPLALKALKERAQKEGANWPVSTAFEKYCSIDDAYSICATIKDNVNKMLKDDSFKDSDLGNVDKCFQAFAGLSDEGYTQFTQFINLGA